MIVGIVLAVVLVICIVLLLLFARATGRWCFADDEYGYQDPMDTKRRPRTQAQVYRFSLSLALVYKVGFALLFCCCMVNILLYKETVARDSVLLWQFQVKEYLHDLTLAFYR